MKRDRTAQWLIAGMALLLLSPTATQVLAATADGGAAPGHMEVPDDPYIRVSPSARVTSPAQVWEHNGFASIQVNVDSGGNNIVGDAANEPSIAVDPTSPNRMVIGWRQFDTIASNFRQAGWGYTTNAGQTWTFPGVLEPGIFRSDPVLDVDSQGNFVYNSLGIPGGDFCTDNFRSGDGGQSWDAGVFSYGGDKQWMSIDRSGGDRDGHIYAFWTSFYSCVFGGEFNRSMDGGDSYETPIDLTAEPQWGVTAVGPRGQVYVAGLASTDSGIGLARPSNVTDPGIPITDVNLNGLPRFGTGPNPGGLLGQVWVAADPTSVTSAGTVHILASVNPPGTDPLDVHFVTSTDGGATFSDPERVNDDPGTGAWQWFGTMSVAPNGRIDAIWNDTRNDPGGYDSELFYSYSGDGGLTWSPNVALTPSFNPHIGWPQQNKIGDYYDMVSDLTGAHVAYSATFNGEQDVYYLRIESAFVSADDFETGDTSSWDIMQP